MKNTHNWLFHFNDYTGKVHAAKREDAGLLFNNLNSPKVLKSSNIDTLKELINRTNGDTKKLSKIVKNA